MRSLTLLATAAMLGACSSENREQATIDSAAGSLAPATSGTLADTGVGSMGAVSGAPSSGAPSSGAPSSGAPSSGAPSTGSASGGSTSAAPTADSANRDSANRGGSTQPSATRGNQTESGVTNTKTGASTLGPDVMKTRPDQGKATTSKGDTVTRAQPPR